jgi:hypothetical protein
VLQIKIDNIVAELETWFNRNGLIINAAKTGKMLFNKQQSHFLVKSSVTFDNTAVDYAAETKFLSIQNKRNTKMALPYTIISQ